MPGPVIAISFLLQYCLRETDLKISLLGNSAGIESKAQVPLLCQALLAFLYVFHGLLRSLVKYMEPAQSEICF